MVVGTMKRRRKRRNWKQIQRKIERGRGEDSGRLRQRERERQPDREVVSVYQEHTALAASSLSVVVPSSSLLQHLPERHQAEQDPDPSTAPSQDQSPINCLLLQAQLSSSALPAPYLSVSTPNHVSNPESGPSGLYLSFPYNLGLGALQRLIFLCCRTNNSLSRPPHLISLLQPLPIQMPLYTHTMHSYIRAVQKKYSKIVNIHICFS